MLTFDWQSLIKYLLEGVAVALAAYIIPRKTLKLEEIVIIALSAAATFALLDQFSPSIGAGARQGTGFGIGFQLVQPTLGGIFGNAPTVASPVV